MPRETTREAPKLDQRKLLGFRNLPLVTTSGKDIGESSQITFNKIGSGGGESEA